MIKEYCMRCAKRNILGMCKHFMYEEDIPVQEKILKMVNEGYTCPLYQQKRG